MPDLQVRPAPKSAGKRPTSGRGKNGVVAAILAVALGSAGIVVWLRSQRSTSAGASEVAGAESTLPLETFVVNLTGANLSGADGTGSNTNTNSKTETNDTGDGHRAYLRVGITLGLAHPLARSQAEAPPTAIVRDTVLSVIASAHPDELMKPEGKRQLKDELLKALQERVPQLAIENVYFTEFLVQM
jgi:flagellar basal body-associated protein FliL